MLRKTPQNLVALSDRGPLRVMFMSTSMPVGGAETLLVNLIRRLDREMFQPELCCLKDRGPLGDELAREIPVFSNLIAGKYDLRIMRRLPRLLRERRIDAVVTVGAGDKMFWGRLAAARVGVPVIASALHSTGWPDVIGRLNRALTPITDAFIGVAAPHGRYLVEVERFPSEKVHVIPNGIDTDRFCPLPADEALRASLDLSPNDRVVAIVAALRPEKDHELLLRAIAQIRMQIPTTKLLVIGDGPERPNLERLIGELNLADAVRLCGVRSDVPQLMSLVDVFALCSRMEANPVSILEAFACAKPVVATDVGSIRETVIEDVTGCLVRRESDHADPLTVERFAGRLIELLSDPARATKLGAASRAMVVARWSLDRMVRGYEALLTSIYSAKCPPRPAKTAKTKPGEGLCPAPAVR
jgi:glycosyltransferase involved in cell wall biosynthesis